MIPVAGTARSYNHLDMICLPNPVAPRDPLPGTGTGSPPPARRWLRRLPFVAVALLVLVLGLEPVPLPQLFPRQDKLHHLLGFAALCFTTHVAFPRARSRWLIPACLLAALLIELCQGLFLPYRTASLGDMLANTLGVALGWACARQTRPPSPKGTSPNP